MPALQNPRHEGFAQQHAVNGNATQSYLAAFGDSVKGAAQAGARLLKRGDVQARIEEIRGEIAQRHEISVDSLVAELDEMIALAKQDPKSYSSAVNAITAKAKISGNWVDRVQVSTEAMSDEELVAAIKSEQAGSIIPWADVLAQSRGKR